MNVAIQKDISIWSTIGMILLPCHIHIDDIDLLLP